MSTHARLAFDRASARTFDKDGRLHVGVSHISKACVSPYQGREIPNSEALGLDPNRVYYLYRDPDELAKAAPTFNNLPILSEHVPVSAAAPRHELVVGSIGSDVAFEAPYLDASLCVWDARLIAAIESEQQRELSSAYHYTADMTPGVTPEGDLYDGVMRDIQGNHLALVDVGRAGPDVVVADSDPFVTQCKDTPAMKQTKLGKALLVALSAASPKLAMDSALPSLVGEATKAKLDRSALRKLAQDAEFDPQQLDNIIDAVLDVEQSPEPMTPDMVKPAEDEDGGEHGKIIEYLRNAGVAPEVLEGVGNMLKTLTGNDEDPQNSGDPAAYVSAAMDSMRAEFRALEQAKVDVKPTVGDVIGMDSADDVYRFALDQLGVDHAGVSGAALGKMYKAVSARPAMDASPLAARAAAGKELVAQIPGLARFGK
jgi:hypothetical protein